MRSDEDIAPYGGAATMDVLMHKGTVTLETERLILRRYSISDAEVMFRNWANDPQVAEYMTWEKHPNVEFTRELLAGWVEEYAKENNYFWCIVLKEIGEPIGSISVVGINEQALSAEIGYGMSRAFWGKGIMPEALHAVLRFLFVEVGFFRIHAKHDIRNPKSGRVMEKCGMRYEGTICDTYQKNNQVAEFKQYAILRTEI